MGRGEVTRDLVAEGAVEKWSLCALMHHLVGTVTYEDDIDDTPEDRGDGASDDEPMGPLGVEVISRRGQFYLFTVEHFMVRQDS